MVDSKDLFTGINLKMIPNKKVEITNSDNKKQIRELLDASYQGVKRLFSNSRVKVDGHRKYFLPGVNIENYNIDIDERNFYD